MMGSLSPKIFMSQLSLQFSCQEPIFHCWSKLNSTALPLVASTWHINNLSDIFYLAGDLTLIRWPNFAKPQIPYL